MTIKIPLRVRGLDLREPEAYDRIHPDLAELSWEANGAVSLAVLYSDESASIAMSDAGEWSRRIVKLMPGVCVQEVYDELVSVSDIAARTGVAAEAVRLWAAGKRRAVIRPFPRPRQVVGSASGGKTMNLYAWREVATWVRDVIGTDPDDGIDYLSDGQLANLNAELASIVPAAEWHLLETLDLETERVIADVQQLCSRKVNIGTAKTHVVQVRQEPRYPERNLKLNIAF